MTFEEAKLQVERYGMQLHGMHIKGDPRSRVAFACFAIAHQHHTAILMLLDRQTPLHATAFALLRPLLEATLRGEWTLHCATDDQVKVLALGGKKQLDMVSVIAALEKVNQGSDAHRILYKDNWGIMSAYPHTSEHQIQHWLIDGDVYPVYAPSQLAWLLNAATACFRLCVSSINSLVSVGPSESIAESPAQPSHPADALKHDSHT